MDNQAARRMTYTPIDSCSRSTRSWSTDSVSPRDREAYWVEAISTAFLAMHSRPRERGDFRGTVRRRELGELALMQVDSRAQDVARLEHHLHTDAPASFYLITQLDRPWAIHQAGRYIELAAGDLALVDAAQPYRFHCPDDVHNLSLEMPRAWLARWLSDPTEHVACRISRESGPGSALRGLLQVLSVRTPCATIGADQAIGTVLQWSLGEVQPGALPSDDRWKRIDALLSERLSEPGLQVADLARQLDCSVSTVHRLFSAQGVSFAHRLMQLRLAEAARMLRDPHFRNLSVAEIGRRCGFLDASHFGRSFVRRHRCTPGVWRSGGS